MPPTIVEKLLVVYVLVTCLIGISGLINMSKCFDYDDSNYKHVNKTNFVLDGTYEIYSTCIGSRCGLYSVNCGAYTQSKQKCLYEITIESSQSNLAKDGITLCKEGELYTNGYYGNNVCYATYPNHAKIYYKRRQHVCNLGSYELMVCFIVPFLGIPIAYYYDTYIKTKITLNAKYSVIPNHETI